MRGVGAGAPRRARTHDNAWPRRPLHQTPAVRVPAGRHGAAGGADRRHGHKNAGKGKAQHRGGGGGQDWDEVRSKQQLLQQLTRQAEEHTRMLERERAALLAMGFEVSPVGESPAAPDRSNAAHPPGRACASPPHLTAATTLPRSRPPCTATR